MRPTEQLILFPALARPLGAGRWEAVVRGHVCMPHHDSMKRRLLIRAIARAADVRHDSIVLSRLHERLAPFLVDNKLGRRFAIDVVRERVVLGPSGANGNMAARVAFRAPNGSTGSIVRFSTADDESHTRTFAGDMHLLPARGVSVISDIDDTIKHSNVPDTRDLLRNTFLRAFRPISPVRELLRAFEAAGAAFHYVSASPWQLYSALSAFVTDAGLPVGTFHLKTFRLKDSSALALLGSPRPFKLAAIVPLLTAWPRRKFVLVGDSAELDPEIYGELARRCPRQISAVIIRDLSGQDRDHPRFLAAFGGVSPERWEILTDDADWTIAAARAIERSMGVR